MAGHADLTDAQWARLEPLLPRGKKAVARRGGRNGSSSTPIRWRCRGGSPWRDVPAEYWHGHRRSGW
ncbi:transposase [Nocardia nova]|uniref:transposase n=1 Tax=Nocardia nova TaxID=37330 RepID=UPI0034DDBB6B